MSGRIVQVVGGALVGLGLADVFLTVLVARYGTSLCSERLFDLTWRTFRFIGRRAPERWRPRVLIHAGPTALVIVLATWLGLLLAGFALIYWPMLGRSILAQPLGQTTPTDFVSALYVGADCLTTAGNGDFAPQTAAARLLMTVNCLTGITTITLAITYLVQIYNALRDRNALALFLHNATLGTGDAAEWLAGLSGDGSFEGASQEFSQVAARLAAAFESYHFYASLLYFHFAEVQYAQARVALIVLDAAALAGSAIDPQRHANFVRHGGVERLHRAGLHIIKDLAAVYLPNGLPDRLEPASQVTSARWRKRYDAACDRLTKAGVLSVADAGFAEYVARRREWDGHVRAFAAYLEEPCADASPALVERSSDDLPRGCHERITRFRIKT